MDPINLISNSNCESDYPKLNGYYAVNGFTASVTNHVMVNTEILKALQLTNSIAAPYYQLGQIGSMNGMEPGKAYVFYYLTDFDATVTMETWRIYCQVVITSVSGGTVTTNSAWGVTNLYVSVPADATSVHFLIRYASGTFVNQITFVSSIQLFETNKGLTTIDTTKYTSNLCLPANGSGYGFYNVTPLFDGNEAGGMWSGETSISNAWATFNFNIPQAVRCLKVCPYGAATHPVFRIDYSDDNSLWEFVSTIFIPSSIKTFVELPNVGAHKYWRVHWYCRHYTYRNSFHIYEISMYGINSVIPTINIDTYDRIIISDESGCTSCAITFTASVDLQAWEARATAEGITPARGVGLLVGSGTTLSQGSTGLFDVEYTELSQGDQEYIITVYGQSTSGSWSE